MTSEIKKHAVLEETLSTADVARYCRVSLVHVNRWIKDGKIKCYRYPGGRYKISKENFREFLESNSIPVIEEFFGGSEKMKILVGEDEPDFAKGIKLLLEDAFPGSELMVADDGYEVLMKMGEFKPDLLILDICMPRIDGLEVCCRIRKDPTRAGTKILAITGSTKTYNREKVLASGADEYLIKPFESEELFRLVRKLIGDRSEKTE